MTYCFRWWSLKLEMNPIRIPLLITCTIWPPLSLSVYVLFVLIKTTNAKVQIRICARKLYIHSNQLVTSRVSVYVYLQEEGILCWLREKEAPVPRTNFLVLHVGEGSGQSGGGTWGPHTPTRDLYQSFWCTRRDHLLLSHSHSIFFSFSLIRSRFLIRKN